MNKIKEHEVLLKKLGYKKLDPNSRYYPIGGPEGPGTAIYNKDRDATGLPDEIGLYADGSWDRCLDIDEGSEVYSGKDIGSLEDSLRRIK